MTNSHIKLIIPITLFLLIVDNLFAEENKIIYTYKDGAIVEASIGKINVSTTEDDLVKLFGKENLVREVVCDDGGCSCSTILFKNSVKELSISWKDDKATTQDLEKECREAVSRKIPDDIHIETDRYASHPTVGSYWRTEEGIHVGISLLELEKLNGAPIDFESSDSCFNGGIMNYHGGALEGRKDLLEYSVLHFDMDDTKSYRAKYSGIASSKDLPAKLKEKIFLSKIVILFPFRDDK